MLDNDKLRTVHFRALCSLCLYAMPELYCSLNRQLVLTTQEIHQRLFAVLRRLIFTFSEGHVCSNHSLL